MTVYTFHIMNDDEKLPVRNIHGQEFQIKKSFLERTLLFAWIFQVLAIGVNLVGYLIHPMAVEMTGSDKKFVQLLGEDVDILLFIQNVFLSIRSFLLGLLLFSLIILSLLRYDALPK